MNKISEIFGRIKAMYKHKLWRGRLILAVLVTIVVLAVIRISLPYTIIYSASYWLETQGVSATIEDISINIIEGTFDITGANGSKDGDSVFTLDRASIDWEWRPLSRKTIHIKSIELDNINLDAAQYTDAIEIAGLLIKESKTVEQQAEEQEDAVAWGASLNRIDFSDLGFCFRQYDTTYDKPNVDSRRLDYCGNIDALGWQGDFNLAISSSPDDKPAQQLQAEGTFQIKQLSLLNNILEATLIDIGSTDLSGIKINGINNIKLDAINIDHFALLQKSGHSRHKHAVEFKALDITGLSVINLNTIAINSISLNHPVISAAKDEQGKFKYQAWLLQPQAAQADTTRDSATQSDQNSALTIKLGGIKITDTEVCYEQAISGSGSITQALDYCMNLDSTDWHGDIAITTPSKSGPLALAVNGDLSFSGFITTNNLLKRDLLTFDKLDLYQIAVRGLDNIAFGKLDLDNATGLELTTTEDRHSLTVAGIDLDTFSYSDNALMIGTLAINELGMDITQNEDGTLDLEKWNIGSDAQQAETGTETGKPGEERLRIKIGEFSLNTTKLLQFTDSTVKPAMQVGLNELHFNIKQLDSEKPKQRSPLELSAKTTRHGTIEIKGVAMPFETKPSFDASGKITGVDLRVASPKAEQAIGHIIKSGQLDADLKLLSEQGQLDSKIGLVLYHFKLKAKSKQDAAALDETFGMPINQSMMLLKDKKGRIKLDIPITGDINNPSFDPTDAIIKATAKATSVTLITFYTPYGLAYAGGNLLFNLATAMNFDPLVFEPGSSKLTDTHAEQLKKLAELLLERPAVHLTLCGFTNLKDRQIMFTETTDPKTLKPASAEHLAKLRQLGSERQENVKNQLVSVGKITHDRLILCEPEHNDDVESIGGVEISI